MTTEWFAFFYFGYFFILAIHVLPFMLLCRNISMLARFAMAIFFTFCCGHLLYIVVPGYGPHQFLAGSFAPRAPGRALLGDGAGDGRRRRGAEGHLPEPAHRRPVDLHAPRAPVPQAFAPYRFSAPVMLLGTSQIIIATMFLRWHYLVDICAGLALATLSVSCRIASSPGTTRGARGSGSARRGHALSFRT